MTRLKPSPAGSMAPAPAVAARIGLGRCGWGLPTAAMLDFQAAHARARDAVHEPLDVVALSERLAGRGTIAVASQATDRANYLRNPYLGRRLDAVSVAALERGNYDAAFVIADGLSATATHQHAGAVLSATLELLPGWRVAPIVIARQARVALGDQIGEQLGARLVVVLLGERPGLSASDSLGIYLTWAPRVGRLDSERNCISNVRPGGLSYEEAAARLVRLMCGARQAGLTGIDLKDTYGEAARLAGPVTSGR